MPDNRFREIATDFARMKALGANIVRLPLYPGYYFLIGSEKYLSTYVDRMIDLAEQNGLYVIISYHTIGRPGGWYSSDSDTVLPAYPAKLFYTDSAMAVEFWDSVAARYGKRKHVLFEIYNEPMDETANFTWADWRPTGELLIATIRKNSDNIVLGSGPKYSSDLSDVPKNPYSDSDLVYVAHVYPGSVPKGDYQVSEWERLFGFLAKTYPVIVSEWGFHNGGDVTTNGTLAGYGKPLIDYLDQKKIHWVAFTYQPPDAEPPMLESDWTTLNEFGEFVKQHLQPSAQTIAENGAYQTPTSTNLIMRIRTVSSAAVLGGKAGIEIEVWSNKEFPVRNELAVLRIGAQEFTLSRYPESGDTHTLIFTLAPEEFAQTATGDLVTVQYGRGGESGERWDFGPLHKSFLNKENFKPTRTPTASSSTAHTG